MTDTPEPDPIQTYKLPFDTCDKFRAVNSRTQSLTQLDVRLGLEQVMDDPQFVTTANLRGHRTAPAYALELARFAHAVLTEDAAGQQLDFDGEPVPDEIRAILDGAAPDQEPLF